MNEKHMSAEESAELLRRAGVVIHPVPDPNSLSGGVAGTWSYECLPRKGRCQVDDAELTINLRLDAADLSDVPDVRKIEAWLDELLKTPTTVEKVAAAAWRVSGLTATATGRTANHGPITFRVPS